MGSWSENNICIKADINNLEAIKKICECYGLDEESSFDVYHSSDYGCGDFDYFDISWNL